MPTNPFIMRFRNGATYKLRSSPDFPRLLGGTMTVRSEIKPTDQWGNRIILADFMLHYPDGRIGTKLAARCFVEEGYATFKDAYGERQIPVEHSPPDPEKRIIEKKCEREFPQRCSSRGDVRSTSERGFSYR